MIFDEISLKKNLQWNPKEDIIHRLVANAKKGTNGVANTEVPVSVSGIAMKWIHPVAFLTGDGSSLLSMLLKKLIS